MTEYYVPTKRALASTRILEVVEKTDNIVATIAVGRMEGVPFKRARVTSMEPRSFRHNYKPMLFGTRDEITQALNMAPSEFDEIVNAKAVYRARDLYSFDQIKAHHKAGRSIAQPQSLNVQATEPEPQTKPGGIDIETRIRHMEDLLLNVSIEVGQLRAEIAKVTPSLKEAVDKIDSLRRLAYEQEFLNQSNGVDA